MMSTTGHHARGKLEAEKMRGSCGEENDDRNGQQTDFLKHGIILQETAMAGTLIHL